MRRKLLIFLGLVILAAMLLPGLGRPSNCGGNSAALSSCQIFGMQLRLEMPKSCREMSSDSWRSRVAEIPSHWLGSADFYLRNDDTALGPEAPRLPLLVCDRAFRNVPQASWWNLWREAPPSHAVTWSDGSTGLISPEAFAALDFSRFVKLGDILRPAQRDPAKSKVRVAAIQGFSALGAVAANRECLLRLSAEAATQGAEIIVFPECAISGYMDPKNGRVWRAGKVEEDGEVSLEDYAEIVPGPSTAIFSRLAREKKLWLVITLAEKDGERFYNSQVLLGPDGTILGHHRKKSPWLPGDASWMCVGDRPLQVIPSPWGRLGLMICHDFQILPEELARAKADIVLYSVGWYGPNPEQWFHSIFPRRCSGRLGLKMVVANWTSSHGAEDWPGVGASCVLDGGVVVARAKDTQEQIVIADLPLMPNL